MHIRHTLPVFLALILSTSVFSQTARWYSVDQVTQGQQIFERRCAKCHGENAQGEPDWRKANEDGTYPPPPLNGNAYAWHHTLDQLRSQIEAGSDVADGDMPSFKNKLSDADIDAVIAYFQSKWNDHTYEVWLTRQLRAARKRLAEHEEPQQHMSTYWLKQHLSGASISPGVAMKTPVKGIREVKINEDIVYLSEDGRYAFTGHLIDLSDGADLTELNQAMETRRLINSFSQTDMLVYPAQGKERTQLTIFTDTSCAYCRKMHKEVPRLQSEGVSVHFIPYPRRGPDSKAYHELKSIWCSDDPGQALSTMMADNMLLDEVDDNCDRAKAVDAGYQLGNRVGISGTPFLVLQSGETIKGYKPASEVMSQMDLPALNR